jgi:hypothetical protein
MGRPLFVLFFECAKEEAERRFLRRRLVGRESDGAALFKKQYQQFEELNIAILAHYKGKGVLVEVGPLRKCVQSILMVFRLTRLVRLMSRTRLYCPHRRQEMSEISTLEVCQSDYCYNGHYAAHPDTV